MKILFSLFLISAVLLSFMSLQTAKAETTHEVDVLFWTKDNLFPAYQFILTNPDDDCSSMHYHSIYGGFFYHLDGEKQFPTRPPGYDCQFGISESYFSKTVTISEEEALVYLEYTGVDLRKTVIAVDNFPPTTYNYPPTLTVPDDIVQETAADLALVLFSVSSTDVEDGDIIPVCSHKNGDKFPVGQHTVTCTATDSAGNTVTKTFTITITEWQTYDTWHGVDSGISAGGGEISESMDIPEPRTTLPSQQKQVFQWWAEGLVSDEEMMNSIIFMFEEGIISSEKLEILDESSKTDSHLTTRESIVSFPPQQKQVLQWWADDLVSDEEVMNNITFLFETETLQSPKIKTSEKDTTIKSTFEWSGTAGIFYPGQPITFHGTANPGETVEITIENHAVSKGDFANMIVKADENGFWEYTLYLDTFYEDNFVVYVSSSDLNERTHFKMDRYPSEPVSTELPDGTKITTKPTGTIITEHGDGTVIFDSEQMKTTHHPDKSVTVERGNSKSTYFTDGTAIKEDKFGNLTFRTSDGTEITINPDDDLDEIDKKFNINSEEESSSEDNLESTSDETSIENDVQTSQAATNTETITGDAPLYRLVGMYDHFYTTDVNEKNNAIGYTYERIEGYVFSTQEQGTTPLYRLFNGVDHFYVIDVTERNNAMTIYGYLDEGIEGYVYSTQEPGTVPLYRLFNGEHFYTTDLVERNNAMTNLGYVDEGIECYVFPSP